MYHSTNDIFPGNLFVLIDLFWQLYQTGTEQFNTKPTKGVSFLQEHNLLKTPLDCDEVVKFLRENPKLDKRQIGEYVSNKKHKNVMEAFMRFVSDKFTWLFIIFYQWLLYKMATC